MAFYQYSTQVLTGQAVVVASATEVAVASTPAPDERVGPGFGVKVKATLSITTGATGTTALVIKIRAGVGTAGAVLQSFTITATTSASYNPVVEFDDTSGTFPIGQYTVTVTATGSSTNGSAFGNISISPLEEN
jgi:hypothetical protein